MRHTLRIAAVSLGLAVLVPAVASAQAVDGYNAPPAYNSAPSNQRVDMQQQNQKQRIREGVQSGELTRGEARELKQDQRQVNRLQRRSERDGVVTPQERARIAQANRATNRDIRQEKHDRQERPSFGIHSW
jgi:hypothetical protein